MCALFGVTKEEDEKEEKKNRRRRNLGRKTTGANAFYSIAGAARLSVHFLLVIFFSFYFQHDDDDGRLFVADRFPSSHFIFVDAACTRSFVLPAGRAGERWPWSLGANNTTGIFQGHSLAVTPDQPDSWIKCEIPIVWSKITYITLTVGGFVFWLFFFCFGGPTWNQKNNNSIIVLWWLTSR